jgi:hypothetical protein
LGGRSDQFGTFDCGDIDQVRMYGRALAPEEIRKDAKAVQPGLVQAWDFEVQPGQDAAAGIVKMAGVEPQYRKLLDKLAAAHK